MKSIKGILKLIVIAAFAMLATPLFMYAQDSTVVAPSDATDLLGNIVTWLETKWPVIASIGTALFVLSEILGNIPAVKANSVYQLIAPWIAKLFGKKK
ncbi:MAG: hypothetical protein EKK39_14900 [Sphingobacteriales bacterium]|nr:MAG: hypothetical protein EKK39_14900 [Sphingobacteriales bacterium]